MAQSYEGSRFEIGQTASTNDGCDQKINQRETEAHEHNVCEHRQINCEYCGESIQYVHASQQLCQGKGIQELRTDLAGFRSYVQDEVVTEIRNLTRTVCRIEENFSPPGGKSGLDSRAEIVVAGGEGIKSTIVLNVDSGKWRCLAATYACEAASSVLDKNDMYVAGGSVGHITDIVKQLDLSQHNAQWIESDFRLPFACRGHITILHQSSLFVIGGITESQDLALDTIHVIPLTPPYKPELLCKLPTPKCFHGTVVINSTVYIVGGCKLYANTSTNAVIEYNPANNACTYLKPLSYAVSGMAIASWQNKILLIGGLSRKGDYLDSVIMYDVSTQRHHILPKMQKKRAYCTAAVVGNKLIVTGGADERSSWISSVERYDFETYTWTDMEPMDEPRAYATAVVNYL